MLISTPSHVSPFSKMADVGDNIPPEEADQGVVLDGEGSVETPRDEEVPAEGTEPQTGLTDPPVKPQEGDLPTPTNGDSVGQEIPVIQLENNDASQQVPAESDNDLSPQISKDKPSDTAIPQLNDPNSEEASNETQVTSTPVNQPVDSSAKGLIASGDSKPDQAPPDSNDTATQNTKTPEISTSNGPGPVTSTPDSAKTAASAPEQGFKMPSTPKTNGLSSTPNRSAAPNLKPAGTPTHRRVASYSGDPAKSLSAAAREQGFLVCQICSRLFTKPKLLDCLHTFCLQCLRKQVPQGATKFVCPTCDEAVSLEGKENGVDDLRDDVFMDGLAEAFKHQQGLKETKDMAADIMSSVCNICPEKTPAASHCVQCSDFLCQECSQIHHRTKYTKTHRVLSLKDFKFLRHEENYQQRARQMVACPKHDGEYLKFFCDSCQIPVCLLGLFDEHKDHKYSQMKDIVSKTKMVIETFLRSTNDQIRAFETAMNVVAEVEKDKKKQREDAEREIMERVELFTKSILDYKDGLLSDLDMMFTQERVELSTEREKLEFQVAKLRSSCEFTGKLLKYGTQTEVVDYQDHVTNRLNQLSCLVPRQTVGDIDAIRATKLKFITEDADVQYIVQKLGYIENQAPDILNLSTEGRQSSLHDILETSDSLKVSGLADGEEDEGVDPGVTGRARLMLEFGGKGDDDGHFMAPAGVQVTPEGDFVVADSDTRRLQVFDGSGKFKYKIKTSMYPRNVAITQDNIFIVSGNLHGEGKVQMLTPTGSFLGEFGTTGQFEYAYGLVVDKNGRIVVTDVHKHRVSIHLPDGRLIHQFGVFGNEDHHFNKPYNVAVNAKNNILVSDKHNQCVKMFDSRGTFIKKVGRDGTKDNNLVFPYGLCVDATDDIIVADSTPYPVKLFDCDGKFREYLIISDEPQQGPRALCITPEGRLVVSERDKQVVRVYSLS
ncbi:PREDICTED: E3 ubiquitin-protein ligase TRIM71-like [Branchiostoma belcheri]|uniref:RING-type E3 ubiquitin transferase n=1 Tax=Branchiostoma belcheri TaxID=7741 RepID=A0A6P4XYK1_BRABE|nr:PREDICTED: E3 ubiquitin-protein ligase TRIM71-like [Branchiostoma belcheri]